MRAVCINRLLAYTSSPLLSRTGISGPNIPDFRINCDGAFLPSRVDAKHLTGAANAAFHTRGQVSPGDSPGPPPVPENDPQFGSMVPREDSGINRLSGVTPGGDGRAIG